MPSVLIVDDSAEVLAVVRNFLERASEKTGFTVCGEASNGLDAIKQAEVLKRLLPKTQIVLFSNYTDEIGTTLAKVVGIDLVLPKGSLSDMAQSLANLSGRDASNPHSPK